MKDKVVDRGCTLEYVPGSGETITETARQMVLIAGIKNKPVTSTFNDVELCVESPMLAFMEAEASEKRVVEYYHAECERRRAAYEASPEGQKAARKAEEFRKRAAESEAKGIEIFSVRDAVGWQRWVDSNQDGYGACCVRYTARWAHLMEVDIAAGKTVEQCADSMSRVADTEGITGFMYGCAVQMLAQVWEHGETLRRWHNLKTQLRDEGEKANKSGGVLNPALLRLG